MKNLSGEQLAALAFSTGLKLARENDIDELLILADFFSLLGSMLILLHDRADLDNPDKDSNKNSTFPRK